MDRGVCADSHNRGLQFLQCNLVCDVAMELYNEKCNLDSAILN